VAALGVAVGVVAAWSERVIAGIALFPEIAGGRACAHMHGYPACTGRGSGRENLHIGRDDVGYVAATVAVGVAEWTHRDGTEDRVADRDQVENVHDAVAVLVPALARVTSTIAIRVGLGRVGSRVGAVVCQIRHSVAVEIRASAVQGRTGPDVGAV